MNNIRALAARLEAVKRQAEALGIFTGDRELLECHVCGLMEDVDTYGWLMTYESSEPIEDSGLRFAALDEGHWRCPSCGAVVEEKK
jgi:rubredoxin